MTMKTDAARIWADVTGKNVGKPIAIVLDGIHRANLGAGGTLAMVAGKGGRNTAGLHERQARRILKTLHPVGVGTGGLACSAADAPLRVDVDEAVHPHFLSK